MIMAEVREKLLGSNLAPLAVARSGEDRRDDPQSANFRAKLAEFFKMAPTQGVLPIGNAPATTATPTIPPPSVAPPAPLPMSLGSPREARDEMQLGEGASEGQTRAFDAQASSALPPSAPSSSAIQLHNSYLVAQSDDGMIIIDQHALHERIMYEELSARIMRGPLESQRLLIPETLAVSSRQMALLEHIQPLLAKLGIEVTAFGPKTVAVQAFPSFLHKLEPGAFVTELLERGEQELLDLHEEELLHEILDMMACKAAVKAGDPLTPAEIEALLARRELIERSSNCPHGRPTTLRLSLRDLEKQFKRTGF
jgi:DNA mismatch repair protein MutL